MTTCHKSQCGTGPLGILRRSVSGARSPVRGCPYVFAAMLTPGSRRSTLFAAQTAFR